MMRQVLELTSERVFVPLTVGGGIRSHTDDTGKVSAFGTLGLAFLFNQSDENVMWSIFDSL